jgi:hypothetical protein
MFNGSPSGDHGGQPMRNLLVVVAVTGWAAASSLALADTPPSDKRPSQCFESHDWQGWKAPNAKTMYINVQNHNVYRIDFSGSCPELLYPDAHLITEIHGSSQICSPVDLDLKVSDTRGFATPCIVSKITPMSPAEVSALPKKYRP